MGHWTTETSVLFQNKMCHYYVWDDGSPGTSVAVEGKIKSTGDKYVEAIKSFQYWCWWWWLRQCLWWLSLFTTIKVESNCVP